MQEEPSFASYEALLRCLDELSDKSWQETAWLGLIPGVMALVEEAVNDGFAPFRDGLKSGYLEGIYSAGLCAKGGELDLLLDQVWPYDDIEDMIQSENMDRVRKVSAELAVLLKKEGRPPSGWFMRVPSQEPAP